MRRRLIIVFLLIVLGPVGLLAYLGVRLARDEQMLVRDEMASLERERLRDIRENVKTTLEELERRFIQETELPALEPDALRALTRKEPLFRQTFALAADGRVLHPPVQGAMSAAERAFLQRTKPIWNRDAVLYSRPGAESAGTSTTGPAKRGAPGSGDSILDLAERSNHGWITWYWEEGLHLLFWRRATQGGGGGVVGAEVERVVLLSRILSKLPASELEEGRIVLADTRGDTVYQWGKTSDDGTRGQPSAALALEYPLDFLRLEYFAANRDVESLVGGALFFNLMLGLGAVVIALLVLAAYFHREYARDLRDAAQRVSFVTQVSHELKTPLTNIRLYAELLEASLDDEDGASARRIAVIVSESQRLTRLINNILTFSKQRGGKLKINRSEVQIDEVIETVLDQFAPLLEAKSIATTFEAGAARPISADRDALGQILANLVSNVEKYAAGGGALAVTSVQENGRTVIRVRDRGPGIPREHRERIFEPFYRVSDKLADGVTGTGIGLTIARELARLHEGDLVLASSDGGACFELIL